MDKHYRNLNGIIGQSKEIIHQAYDKGYKAGKSDYEKQPVTWEHDYSSKQYLQFKCSGCGLLSYADYPYCPWCGCPAGGKE